jgi:hypothetical protein
LLNAPRIGLRFVNRGEPRLQDRTRRPENGLSDSSSILRGRGEHEQEPEEPSKHSEHDLQSELPDARGDVGRNLSETSAG